MQKSINRNTPVLIFLVFYLLSCALQAQNLQSVHTDKAEPQNFPVDSIFVRYLDSNQYYAKRNRKLQYLYLDSARYYLDKVSKPRYKAVFYNNLGDYYLKTRYLDSSLIYQTKAMKLVKDYNIKDLLGAVNFGLGYYYFRVDNYDSALYYFRQNIKFYTTIDSIYLKSPRKYNLGRINNNIGSIFLNKGEYDSAIVHYYKALNIYQEMDSTYDVSYILNNLGSIYYYHKDYEKALENYTQALKTIIRFSGNKKLVRRASIYLNMGNCYKALDQLDTAMAYYEKAMAIRKNSGPPSAVAGLHDNIGNIKKAKGDYKGAMQEYRTSLKIREKIGAKRWLASSYGNIGLLFVKMGKNREAIPYLKRAVEIADSNSFVEIALICREGLSVAYRNLGNYKKAYETYVQYSEQNDSVHRIELEEKLNYYKELFEAEKKDRLIQKLEEEQKLADLNNEKQKILVEKQTLISNSLIVFSSLLLTMMFFIYRYFKMKRKADKEMHLRKEQLNKQKTLDLMKELEVSTIKSFMEGQEKERARIAGDLHDRLGSLLSTVKLHFNSLEPILTKDPEAAKNYRYAIELLDKSVEEVRAVSRNLTQGVLTQFGLLAAVENMRDAINSARKVKMTVINSGMQTRLKSETEIALFRVIQELVTNVIRHAQTDEIFVQFVGADDRLNIIVEDHGIGFDKDNIKSEGIGLNNLKERIESIGGEFTIDSIPGEGTTIIIDIPYETAA
jgi:signal transduction histidine kinase